MKNRYFICILPYFNFGGVSTYYYRMLKWAKKNHYKAVLLTKTDEYFEWEWAGELNRNGIEVIEYKRVFGKIKFYNLGTNKLFFMLQDSEVSIITSSFFEYFIAEICIKKMKNIDAKIFFYFLHPYAAKYTNFDVINKIYYKYILKKLVDSNRIILMDEEVKMFFSNMYLKYMGTEMKNCPIIRLGMDVEKLDIKKVLERKRQKEFVIVSVCRMDFPFKGYVFGLIDDFIKLKAKYCDMRLLLIGDGDDQWKLQEKIEKCDANIKKSIYLSGNVSYVGLKQYISNANILIGQGTTLLDGASMAIPGVIASAYQTENFAYGFFHDMPNVLGGILGEKGSKNTTIYESIETIYTMTELEYLDISVKTHEEYKKNYDINNCMRQLENISTYPVTIGVAVKMFFNIICCLVNIKKKLKRS